MLYWTHILRSSPFHYNHGVVWFLSHKYILNTMNITNAKIKKKSQSRLFKPKPARASLISVRFTMQSLQAYGSFLGIVNFIHL